MMSRPEGLIDGPAAWHPRDLADSDWLRILPNRVLSQLDAGLEKLRDTPIRDLPRLELGPTFDEIRREVLHGKGFVLLRGVATEGRSIEDLARLFWAIGLQFGSPLPQNAKGHLLGHVKNLGLRATDPNVRIYQTNDRQFFHTDSCDIVGLLCLNKSRSGGLSSLASSWTAYNEMFRRDPELARALFEPIWTDQRGEHAPGSNPWYSIPVFSWVRDRLIGSYQRKYIESAQRFPGAPRLSATQVKALDLLDGILEEIALRMAFEPGDIQFVHNHQIFHDRTAFEDDPAHPRHLLRLWLTCEDDWELPEVFAERYGTIAKGRRGGIRIPGLETTVSLNP